MDYQTISLLTAISHAANETDAAKALAVDARKRLSEKKAQIREAAASALQKYPLL